ncbi:MAG TPA: sigma-70 family RNA polymerase sigma factor [Byssovorax sp.]
MTRPRTPPERPSALALGVRSDDAAALTLVVRSVVAAVLGEPRDHPDVEDGTHEALRRAIEGHARLREGEPVRPWVIGIARHVALDMRRSRRRARREDSIGDESGDRPVLALVDPAPGPDERAWTAERTRRLDRALAALPDAQRDALVLFHVEGLGYVEIAARLGVAMGTVATWLARGRKAVAEALGEAGAS